VDPEVTTSIGTGMLTFKLDSLPSSRNILRSSHVAASGSQSIYYPAEWEGIISCQVQVGSCHFWGHGLEIIESRNNNTGLNVYMKAVKGKIPYHHADTSIELRGGPVEVGIGVREKGDREDELLGGYQLGE
jgi:hypothetical protein